MTKRELDMLAPWLEAGVGVRVNIYAEPVLVRKHYLISIEDGYALTQRGYDYATRLAARLESSSRQGGGSDGE